MEIRDITKEQLETLVLIRSLEEFITDEHENLSSISDVVCTFADNLETKEFERLGKDICALTRAGYVISDMTEVSDEELEFKIFPKVDGITPKGQTTLNEWEQEVKSEFKREEKEVHVINNHYSIFGDITINNSLLSMSGSLFGAIGKAIKVGGKIKP